MDKKYKMYDKITVGIQKVSPSDGDIIVISFPDDIEPTQMMQFAEGLKPQIPENVTILCTRAGVTIDRFPDVEINKLGWYKFDTAKAN